MLHVADGPWLGGDYCMEHARAVVASTPLIVTCKCPVCARARPVVSDGRPEATLAGPGSWRVITETSSYVLDLDAAGAGTLLRRPGTGQGVAPEAVDFPPPLAVELRRDGEAVFRALGGDTGGRQALDARARRPSRRHPYSAPHHHRVAGRHRRNPLTRCSVFRI